MRLSRRLVVESLESKWDNQRTVEKRRGTLLGVGQPVGNDRLWAGNYCWSWHLGLYFIELYVIP
jgi:hypothetical protein